MLIVTIKLTFLSVVTLNIIMLKVVALLYYKTIMIGIMTIVSDATIWSVTNDHN
jgi:hypothetical protein